MRSRRFVCKKQLAERKAEEASWNSFIEKRRKTHSEVNINKATIVL